MGYGLAHPEIAEVMNRVRQPFNVNHLALTAAAAALEDHEFIARSREDELPGKSSRVTVPHKFTDVTKEILAAVPAGAADLARSKAVETTQKTLVAACEKRPGMRCSVAIFDGGLQYVLIETIELTDIRLVESCDAAYRWRTRHRQRPQPRDAIAPMARDPLVQSLISGAARRNSARLRRAGGPATEVLPRPPRRRSEPSRIVR